jgi:hypothetical protein
MRDGTLASSANDVVMLPPWIRRRRRRLPAYLCIPAYGGTETKATSLTLRRVESVTVVGETCRRSEERPTAALIGRSGRAGLGVGLWACGNWLSDCCGDEQRKMRWAGEEITGTDNLTWCGGVYCAHLISFSAIISNYRHIQSLKYLPTRSG